MQTLSKNASLCGRTVLCLHSQVERSTVKNLLTAQVQRALKDCDFLCYTYRLFLRNRHCHQIQEIFTRLRVDLLKIRHATVKTRLSKTWSPTCGPLQNPTRHCKDTAVHSKHKAIHAIASGLWPYSPPCGLTEISPISSPLAVNGFFSPKYR